MSVSLMHIRISADVADGTTTLVLDDAAALGTGAALLDDLLGVDVITGDHVFLTVLRAFG